MDFILKVQRVTLILSQSLIPEKSATHYRTSGQRSCNERVGCMIGDTASNSFKKTNPLRTLLLIQSFESKSTIGNW